MKVTAHASRVGRWWAVEVPEVEGLFTQARRLDQVPAMVADAAALLLGCDPDDVDVAVVATLLPGRQDRVEHVRALQRRATQLQAEAAEASRSLIGELRDEGLTVRDVAQLVGVSPQRVSQLDSRDKPTAARHAGGPHTLRPR